MAIFKGKSLQEKAEDQQAKIRMKQLQVVDKNLDIARIQADKRKRAELTRLTA